MVRLVVPSNLVPAPLQGSLSAAEPPNTCPPPITATCKDKITEEASKPAEKKEAFRPIPSSPAGAKGHLGFYSNGQRPESCKKDAPQKTQPFSGTLELLSGYPLPPDGPHQSWLARARKGTSIRPRSAQGGFCGAGPNVAAGGGLAEREPSWPTGCFWPGRVALFLFPGSGRVAWARLGATETEGPQTFAVSMARETRLRPGFGACQGSVTATVHVDAINSTVEKPGFVPSLCRCSRQVRPLYVRPVSHVGSAVHLCSCYKRWSWA